MVIGAWLTVVVTTRLVLIAILLVVVVVVVMMVRALPLYAAAPLLYAAPLPTVAPPPLRSAMDIETPSTTKTALPVCPVQVYSKGKKKCDELVGIIVVAVVVEQENEV